MATNIDVFNVDDDFQNTLRTVNTYVAGNDDTFYKFETPGPAAAAAAGAAAGAPAPGGTKFGFVGATIDARNNITPNTAHILGDIIIKCGSRPDGAGLVKYTLLIIRNYNSGQTMIIKNLSKLKTTLFKPAGAGTNVMIILDPTNVDPADKGLFPNNVNIEDATDENIGAVAAPLAGRIGNPEKIVIGVMAMDNNAAGPVAGGAQPTTINQMCNAGGVLDADIGNNAEHYNNRMVNNNVFLLDRTEANGKHQIALRRLLYIQMYWSLCSMVNTINDMSIKLSRPNDLRATYKIYSAILRRIVNDDNLLKQVLALTSKQGYSVVYTYSGRVVGGALTDIRAAGPGALKVNNAGSNLPNEAAPIPATPIDPNVYNVDLATIDVPAPGVLYGGSKNFFERSMKELYKFDSSSMKSAVKVLNNSLKELNKL